MLARDAGRTRQAVLMARYFQAVTAERRCRCGITRSLLAADRCVTRHADVLDGFVCRSPRLYAAAHVLARPFLICCRPVWRRRPSPRICACGDAGYGDIAVSPYRRPHAPYRYQQRDIHASSVDCITAPYRRLLACSMPVTPAHTARAHAQERSASLIVARRPPTFQAGSARLAAHPSAEAKRELRFDVWRRWRCGCMPAAAVRLRCSSFRRHCQYGRCRKRQQDIRRRRMRLSRQAPCQSPRMDVSQYAAYDAAAFSLGSVVFAVRKWLPAWRYFMSSRILVACQ